MHVGWLNPSFATYSSNKLVSSTHYHVLNTGETAGSKMRVLDQSSDQAEDPELEASVGDEV